MFGALWKRLWLWINGLFGDSAEGRLQQLIADKLDDISAVKKAQLMNTIAIQKRQDDVAVKKYSLGLESKRLDAEARGMIEINMSRLNQFYAELNEHQANLQAIHLRTGTLPMPATNPVLPEPSQPNEESHEDS